MLTFVILQAQYLFRTVLLLRRGLSETQDDNFSVGSAIDFGQLNYGFERESNYLFRGGTMLALWLLSLPFDIWFCTIIGSYANEGLGSIKRTN